MEKTEWLPIHAPIFKNKTVLDLAIASGESSKVILKQGVNQVYAVEIRPDWLEIAKKNISGNIDFILGDITDYDLIRPLVAKSNVINCGGVFYHLFDHFRFLSNICKPNIEYILIETLFGPETVNPEMFWTFEATHSKWNGWADGCDIVPSGTPNLSWIINAAKIFNFECDYVHCYGTSIRMQRGHLTYSDYVNVKGDDWPPYSSIIDESITLPEFVQTEISTMLKEMPGKHRRMILRLYNNKLIKSESLDVADIYKWPV